MSRWAALLVLTLALASQVALAQKAGAKGKPRVVVLEIEGDRRGALRTQVENALKKTGQVQIVRLKQYTAAAAKAKLRGARSRTPEAVARVGPALKLDAVVLASSGEVLAVRVLSGSGQDLWTKDVKLQRGKLSASEARRLAAGIATTAATPPPVVEPAPEPAAEPAAPPPAAAEAPASPPAATEPATPPAAATPPVAAEAPPTAAAPPASPAPSETPGGATPKPASEQPPMVAPLPLDDESHTSSTPFDPYASRAELEAQDPNRHPPLIRLILGGATTWRRYCARPGASSCSEFDGRPEEEREGDTIDFQAGVPYLGLTGQLELLPLARTEKRWLRGLGLAVGASRGYSETRVKVTTGTGETPTRTVVATDTALSAMLLYRYYFNMGTESRPRLGYAGLRGGMLSRAFDVDEQARAPLTGSHRLHPSAGLEASFALRRWLRVEAGGQFFLAPQAGQGLMADEGELELEVRDLGAEVSSSGWSVELGLAGEVWGPLGYRVRGRLTQVKDEFSGRGSRFGWEEGGVAQERHIDVEWGLTASY